MPECPRCPHCGGTNVYKFASGMTVFPVPKMNYVPYCGDCKNFLDVQKAEAERLRLIDDRGGM